MAMPRPLHRRADVRRAGVGRGTLCVTQDPMGSIGAPACQVVPPIEPAGGFGQQPVHPALYKRRQVQGSRISMAPYRRWISSSVRASSQQAPSPNLSTFRFR